MELEHQVRGTGIFVAPASVEEEISNNVVQPLMNRFPSFSSISTLRATPVAIKDAPVKILLVDDHPENLLALEATLGHPGGPEGVTEPIKAEFIRARSGPEALRKVLEDNFAVILLDVQMPEMDGYETAELIRKRRESQYTPIIFLTAISTSEINIFRGYSLGAVDYITKPFDPAVIKAKVSVFVDLFRKRQEIERMADALRQQANLLRDSNAALAKTNQALSELYRELEDKSVELSNERDFANTILETAGSYIIIFDSEGRIERFNKASEQVSGLTTEQARGRLAWETLVTGEDAVKVKEGFERVRKGETVSFEMKIFPVTQKASRYLSMSFTGLYNEASELVNVIASGIDISDRYEAEEKIRRMNEELEQRVIDRTKELNVTNQELRHAKESAELANSAKDKFLAVLSHELRTPLTPVLAIVQMLGEDPTVPAEAKSWVETIGRNVQLEARLIDDLLDLTRIANGKLELHISTVDVHKLIHETIEICHEEISAKKLTVSVDMNATNFLVRADSARLHQVLWNILKNAIKFTPERGVIEIHTSNTSGSLQCQIKDSGIGIPKEHLKNVFQAFDQGSKEITRRFGGLGLGLAISKALIDQHHGTISANSDGVEKGAIFTITIPVADVTNGTVTNVAPKENSAVQNAARILLVEDNSDTSRAMQVLLERKGYHVTVANSVHAAVEKSQENPFDLVISDIGLPDGDGFDVMRRLNAIKPIHGVAISGFGMDEDRRRSREAGFEAHIVKPINFEELSKMVQKLLIHSSRT